MPVRSPCGAGSQPISTEQWQKVSERKSGWKRQDYWQRCWSLFQRDPLAKRPARALGRQRPGFMGCYRRPESSALAEKCSSQNISTGETGSAGDTGGAEEEVRAEREGERKTKATVRPRTLTSLIDRRSDTLGVSFKLFSTQAGGKKSCSC